MCEPSIVFTHSLELIGGSKKYYKSMTWGFAKWNVSETLL